MKKSFYLFGLGFLSWAIPFIISFFFYTKDGVLTIDIFLFKSLMIVIGSFSASVLLILFFKKVSENFVKESIKVGLAWFLINLVLDGIVLLPMSKMSIADYLSQIGLRYLVIPIFTITIGMVVQEKYE